ncbi:MAG: Crp/Fnr family transcriptional regulator [Acidobacteriota bacterium]
MTRLTADVAAALDAIPYVRTLRSQDRKTLAETCMVQTLARGARVFEEGQPPAGVFLILSGRVHLVRSSANGREQILHEEGPGVTLAEVPIFDGGGYVGSAVAAEDSVLLFIPREMLLACIGRSAESAAEVFRVLARQVRQFATLVEDLSLHNVTERIARYLLREAARTSDASLLLPDARGVLAARIGIVREDVSRALSQFKREGVIEMDGRRLRILDANQLKRLAGEAV